MTPDVRPLSFWSTVRLLLRTARHRAAGRRKRQQELLQSRNKRSSTDWSRLGFAFTVIVMLFLNAGAAWVVRIATDSGERFEVERGGKIVVSRQFEDVLREAERLMEPRWRRTLNYRELKQEYMELACAAEARRTVERVGGNKDEIARKLCDSVLAHGSRDLVRSDVAAPGLVGLANSRFASMLGSAVLLWWAVMLVFQGEGLELDLQRRRHPMWEWLFSHPVQPGAVFLAEMLSPIAANPIYWGGPLFVGTAYAFAYDPALGIAAVILIGVPVTIALACLGKALEIGVTLRFPPRSRGAMVGVMSWLGYASMMLFFVGIFAVPTVVNTLGPLLYKLTVVPWPWLRWFLGGHADGSFSFVFGTAVCWFGTVVILATSVWFSAWGSRQGLAGNFGAESAPAKSLTGGARFGKEPLYRKELLWFIRDRSAIVQTILVPITVASFQVFNLRGLLREAQGAWNYLCGAAILFGTYFLWILGPKSLTSEGTALWIALTWPRGLESLLKAKAWLWSLISSGIVTLVLCYAAFLFPTDIWKIALVAVGWLFFSRSMAEKTVTLVTVTSSSGEREQTSWGRRGAAQLGMLTFSIGILTQQWNLAVVGIVFSFITAAAMWENFRARLPYLYDPWSEKVPPPPTLMHAMVAISVLVEAAAVLSGIIVVITGRENIAIAQAVAYAISAVAVSLGVAYFLSNRDVSLHDVWTWKSRLANSSGTTNGSLHMALLLLFGAAGGLALGIVAHGYTAVLRHIPAVAELLRKAQEQMSNLPNLKASFFVMAVLFAPFAEEYLFRGLLYRSLDREWGGWRAVLGSAAFFAIYHPALSWFPVALLGATNAVLFKKTGRLAPAVVLHMVYNAVVLS
jgi:membrane protease YdiL (CAAX protease family)